MGDGGAQQRQARVCSRRDRRTRGHAAHRCGRSRSCVVTRDGRSGEAGRHHRRSVPALRVRSACRLRRIWHRLHGCLRRADLAEADDRPARGCCQGERRAHHILLRLRFDPVRARSVLRAGGSQARLRRAGPPASRGASAISAGSSPAAPRRAQGSPSQRLRRISVWSRSSRIPLPSRPASKGPSSRAATSRFSRRTCNPGPPRSRWRRSTRAKSIAPTC